MVPRRFLSETSEFRFRSEISEISETFFREEKEFIFMHSFMHTPTHRSIERILMSASAGTTTTTTTDYETASEGDEDDTRRTPADDDDDVDDANAKRRRAYTRAKRGVEEMVKVYFKHNAQARSVVAELLRASSVGRGEANAGTALGEEEIVKRVPLDHVAFRSFGIGDMGIDSLCELFAPLGYRVVEDDVYTFPEKNVRAKWLRPPPKPEGLGADVLDLPRIFVSELVMEDVAEDLRRLVEKVLNRVREGELYVPSEEWSKGRNARWQLPSASQYAKVQALSEYAAWTLLHGYAVNHVAVSLFQLRKLYPETPVLDLEGVEKTLTHNAALERVKWNDVGGRIKRSPSGLLCQSSLMATPAVFSLYKRTETEKNRYGAESSEDIFKQFRLPGSYIEFVQRLPKPEHRNKSFEELVESDLRDGFEAGNANTIFDSTNSSLKKTNPNDGRAETAVRNTLAATNATVAEEIPQQRDSQRQNIKVERFPPMNDDSCIDLT